MKTLLFNGCSFMAGDQIVWDQYCLEKKNRLINWRDWADPLFINQQQEFRKFMTHYSSEYRKLYNLPMATSLHLGHERIDISRDGNSNDNIALSTIAYLTSKSIEQRKQYHVCIGWTSAARFLKFLKAVPNSHNDTFVDLHVNHVGSRHGQRELTAIQEYIDLCFQTLTDEDVWINYAKNIMLLENFLISNRISYTFFKALGAVSDVRNFGPFQPFDFIIPEDQLTNNANWLNFGGPNSPYANNSWTSTIIKDKECWISKDNLHPNLHAVANFSIKLANFIKNQGVL